MYYVKQKMHKSSIKINDSYEGETLEAKMRRFMENKEPIGEEAPIIYTERKNGVEAAYDIRTDRWEIAVEAMDKVTQQKQTNRGMRQAERTYDTMSDEQKQEFHAKYPQSKIPKLVSKDEGKP